MQGVVQGVGALAVRVSKARCQAKHVLRGTKPGSLKVFAPHGKHLGEPARGANVLRPHGVHAVAPASM